MRARAAAGGARRLPCGLALLLWAHGAAAAVPPGGPLAASDRAALESLISRSGADVGVAFRTLDGRSAWF